MKRYVIWCKENCAGDFEFLTSTQSNWTKSLENARKEKEELLIEHQHNYEPPLSREEAEEEYPLVILELDVKEVK